MQPRQDTHGAGRSEPRQVRGGQLAGRRRPPEGGVKVVKGIGVDLYSILSECHFSHHCASSRVLSKFLEGECSVSVTTLMANWHPLESTALYTTLVLPGRWYRLFRTYFPFIQIAFFFEDSFGDGIALFPFRPMISERVKFIFNGGLPSWLALSISQRAPICSTRYNLQVRKRPRQPRKEY